MTFEATQPKAAGRARPKAIIAGGGLAGLACAKRLTDAGFQIELVEAEPQLGGRTADWVDPNDGEKIESGVHTFFGVYNRLISLLNEVGVDDDRMVSWDDKVGFLQPGGEISFFAFDPIRDLPRVIGLLLGDNKLINLGEKLMLGFTFGNGLLRRERYEERTIADLANDGRLDKTAYERLLRPLSRGLAFCEPEELSAYVLLTLLTHGITNPFNLRAGTFRGGMTDVMINPIARWLTSRGAVLRTNTALKAIHHKPGQNGAAGQIDGFELANGEILRGDVYVSAIPLEVIKQIIPSTLSNFPYFHKIQNIPTVPATATQIWFDRKVIRREEFIYLAGSPLVVFQDESRLTFPDFGSRISSQITDRSTDSFTDQQYIDLTLQELHRYVPGSVPAQVRKAVVVRHQAIAIKPGIHFQRPVQGSPVPNLFLAGDYTRQDWFTTMEGATRSGEMAARAAVYRYQRTLRYASETTPIQAA